MADRNTLTYWADNALTIACTDSDLPVLPGGGLDSTSGFNGQNRVNDSIIRKSTLEMILVGDGIGDRHRG